MTASIQPLQASGTPGLVGQLASWPIATRVAGTVGALALAVALAACGGSSVGELPVPVPPPVVCTATDGGGTGFALGVCAATNTSAFQPVATTVAQTGESSYDFLLTFPANLPANLSTSLRFTSANRTPIGTRDAVGELRGAAYEADANADADPANATLVPPYSALIDFRQAWLYSQPAPSDADTLQTMTYAGFGVWERFGTASFDDGHFGVWHSPLAAASALDARPTIPREYAGVAVGVISPTAAGGLYTRSYGFSATVTISVNASAGITAGAISNLKIASAGAGTDLTIESVPLRDLAFSAMDNFVGQPQRGALLTSTGTGAAATGVVEARYFGSNVSTAELGREIAGRFRFQTSDGSLRGVGSFGVRAPAVP